MTPPTLAEYRQWLALDQARARHFATRLRLSSGRAEDEDRLLAKMAARRAARTPLPAWMQGRRPAGPATPRHQPALEGWA